MEASLYIHVPFCAGGKANKVVQQPSGFEQLPLENVISQPVCGREIADLAGQPTRLSRKANPAGKCDYCDFYSLPVAADDTRVRAYIKTLLADAERLFAEAAPENVPTVYIGGGTPSLLGGAGIFALLSGILHLIAQYARVPPEEITVEANPESTSEEFLAALREAGATRLSLGVQTFHGPSRRAVHRIGADPDPENDIYAEADLRARLIMASRYFPSAFSVDLMSGLPFQDERILLDDIDAALLYKPAHVSLYSLIVERGTPLETRARDTHFLPAEDEADRLWISGRDALTRAGYGQYEVSNFALPGKESRHNIRYWRMKNWLALGPASSATIIDDVPAAPDTSRAETARGFRYTVPPDIDAWLKAGGMSFAGNEAPAGRFPLPPDAEALDSLTLVKETFLMGFRYIEGPDEALFRTRFHRNIGDFIPETLAAWRAKGFFRKDKIALTTEGLLFLDPFLRAAFGELESSGS